MNKLFLEQYMKTESVSTDKKYLFLSDSQDNAFAVIAAGYCAVLLSTELDYCHNLESSQDYMNGIALTGTYQIDGLLLYSGMFQQENK